MGKEAEIKLMSELLNKMKQAEHEGQTMLKHVADLQSKMMTLGMDEMVDRLNIVFSDSSKVEENLKKLAHDIEIKLNQLKNEAA